VGQVQKKAKVPHYPHSWYWISHSIIFLTCPLRVVSCVCQMMQHARFFLVLLLVRNKAIGPADVLGPCRIFCLNLHRFFYASLDVLLVSPGGHPGRWCGKRVRGVPQFERKRVHFSRLRGLEIRSLSGICFGEAGQGSRLGYGNRQGYGQCAIY
jgi:hypothetical protein